MENSVLTQARERAARDIAKAEREVTIAAALPAIDGIAPPTIVQQARGVAWIVYSNPETFADILRIFDAYAAAHAPAHVTKAPGWAASVNRTESPERETLVSDLFAWVQIDSSVQTGSRASFRMFATLGNGIPAMIGVDIDSGHWNRGAQHRDLKARFANLKPRAVKYREYRCDAPKFLAEAAQVFSARTHANDGSAGHWKGVFMTRHCLAAALATLES